MVCLEVVIVDHRSGCGLGIGIGIVIGIGGTCEELGDVGLRCGGCVLTQGMMG